MSKEISERNDLYTRKIVQEWKSIEIIEKTLKYDKNYINRCCLCDIKTVYGYIWRYVNDLEQSAS